MNKQSKDVDLQKITDSEARIEIHNKFNIDLFPGELQYYAWPRVYGNTAGPFSKPGRIAGQAMTIFTIECWTTSRLSVIFCKGRVLDVREDIDGFYPFDWRV